MGAQGAAGQADDLTPEMARDERWRWKVCVDQECGRDGVCRDLADAERRLKECEEALARERRRTAAMRTALETIKRDYGQVCEEFTECQHPACFGSCGAWMTAEAALDADDASGRPGGEETERNTMAITKSPTSEYVERFAALMERQLAANRHKGDRPGWLGESFDSLKSRLCDEVAELFDEITCDGPSVDIAKEAADVANFCLFIADKAGGL